MKKKICICFFALCLSAYAHSDLNPATFEDLALPDNSYWNGELDEDDADVGYSRSWFESGSFTFNNFYWPSYNTWAFFAYSSRTEKTFCTYKTDQFNSITGSGANGSKTFGVAFTAAYMGNTVMEVSGTDRAVVIPGMEIVNTAWVVDCILNGDGYEGPFKTGDWLCLNLTGYDGNRQTATKTIYLADYRSADPAEHYFLDRWTWFDLSDLGQVTSVRFNIDSSKTNAYGVTTPTYVCIDNVGAAENASVDDIESTTGINLTYIRSTRHIAVSGATGPGAYRIVDMSGNTVAQGAITEPNAVIDVSTLPKGVYIVTAHDKHHRKTLKLIP